MHSTGRRARRRPPRTSSFLLRPRCAVAGPGCSTGRRHIRTSSARQPPRLRDPLVSDERELAFDSSRGSSRLPQSTRSTDFPTGRSSGPRRPWPPRPETRARERPTCSCEHCPSSGSKRRSPGRSRTAGHPLRASARTRDQGLEGRGAEGRPLVRARDHRDPDPRADPRQAGGGRRGPEPLAAPRNPRRHLRRPARHREPAGRLAGQGHLRQPRCGRTSVACHTS